jgi:hypothetical protein
MKPLTALGGGLAGACAVTLLHETARKVVPNAPRMDLLGMNALTKGLKIIGAASPRERQLYSWSLAGDLISNAIFYSIAGIEKIDNTLAKGATLGLAAGLGAVLLPKPMGLEEQHTNRTIETKIMTVGLYVIGGLVAAAVMKLADRRKRKSRAAWEERLVTSSMA